MSNYQLSVKKYPFYKDSGIEWLGDVPEHWEVKRIKEVSDINKRTLTDKTPDDYEFDYIDIGSVTYGVNGFNSERMTFDSSPSRARRIVKKGDTIISTVRTYLKAIASIDDEVSDLIVSTGFAVVSPKKLVFSKYFSYWLTANYTIDEICALSTGVSYPATNASAISNLFCLVPTISEQKSIAYYLDTKTAQCDRKIDLLTQKATQYGKLKQSLINETVTRGLDKSVPMKDSGVEWIGEVPEHWQLKRLKDIGTSIIGITYAPEDALGDKTSGLLVLRSSNIQNGQLSLSDTVYVNKKVNPRQIARKGDILICSRNGSRALIGKNICIDERTEGQTFGAFMTIYRSKYFRFISKFFNSNVFESQSGLFGSSTINQLTVNTLNNFLLILPPPEEQKAIADYLDKKTAQIDQIIQTINIQIEKLKELRKTLINDVVTGKIKVIDN